MKPLLVDKGMLTRLAPQLSPASVLEQVWWEVGLIRLLVAARTSFSD